MTNDRCPTTNLSRRDFLAASAGAALILPSTVADGAEATGPFQATGTRVGEVTDTTAVVWTRLTAHPTRNNDGVVFSEKVDRQNFRPTDIPVAEIEGACPGMPGRVRLRYSPHADLREAVTTDWIDVTDAQDCIYQFELGNLRPETAYHYASEAAAPGGADVRNEFRGKFRTAPEGTTPSDLRFCVMTCQGYPDRDHPDGHPIYPSMLALEPSFLTMTGDLVYYDSNEPRAVTPALARLHWERMFSLPRITAMLRSTATYWLKDDHDTLTNDSWPGMQSGELTFAEGQEIFRQQAPLRAGEKSYRTFR
ncbi:MAG: PhoD-like phosphatase N-terminal domain-containing protein, partial [Planctomycetaceae bacterium]